MPISQYFRIQGRLPERYLIFVDVFTRVNFSKSTTHPVEQSDQRRAAGLRGGASSILRSGVLVFDLPAAYTGL